MKGKYQCFGLLLLLSIMVGLSLNVSSDVNALKHEYMALPFFGYRIPLLSDGSTISTKINSETGLKEIDWDYTHASYWDLTNVYGQFSIGFYGDSYENLYFDDLGLSYNLSFMRTYPNIDTGEPFNSFEFNRFYSILGCSSSQNGFNISASNVDDLSVFPSMVTNVPAWAKTHSFDKFGENGIHNFDSSSLASSPTFGASPFDYGNIVRTTELSYYREYFDGRNFTANGIAPRSHAIDTPTGMHYNHSFSFESDLFNKDIHRFSWLSIPLWDYTNYFLTPSNLYKNREVEFRGVFEFDGSFTWHSNIENDGTFKIHLTGGDSATSRIVSQDFPCVVNNRTVPDLSVNWIEYSCVGTYSYDYLFVSPVLIIEGDSSGNYVWTTDANWYFGGLFLVTDNDETPGQSFDGLIGTQVPGDANHDIDTGSDGDFFQSLANLFTFTFINPFTPLFSMFVDNTSCVHVPIIASMLYVSNDEVCPFFDSNVRSILTPVFTLSSMMLIFGFAVRWLGARSGNLFEDSFEGEGNVRTKGITTDNYHFANKHRSRK